MEVPQNRRFITENSTKMGDLGVPLFWDTTIYEHADDGSLEVVSMYKTNGSKT